MAKKEEGEKEILKRIFFEVLLCSFFARGGQEKMASLTGAKEARAASRSVCLFGLSANPPTGASGHQGIVRKLLSLEKFDEVWILPVYTHMFASKRRLAPFNDRIEMCRRCFTPLGTSIPPIKGVEVGNVRPCSVRVSDIERIVCLKRIAELGENTHSGTAEVLDELKSQFPGIKFSWCLGEDTYRDLVRGKWRRIADIAMHIDNRFEVIRRSDTAADRQIERNTLSQPALPDRESIESIVAHQNSEAQRLRVAGETTRAFGATLHTVAPLTVVARDGIRKHAPAVWEVSSSEIRGRLALGDDEPDAKALDEGTWIDPSVLQYIRERSLYIAAPASAAVTQPTAGGPTL